MNSLEFTNMIRQIAQDEIRKHEKDEPFKIGRIANADGRPTVLFDGESQPSAKRYAYVGSYTPKQGDRVLLARVKGKLVILGDIK